MRAVILGTYQACLSALWELKGNEKGESLGLVLLLI